uniref:Uncharacterized protein n=1 Tax=Myotis myotis TaxID=51298 RepID=A0A7J7V3R3_MYOMY|nr:hypothetical protein mMyoMyo1_008441 [Myotis myotis]
MWVGTNPRRGSCVSCLHSSRTVSPTHRGLCVPPSTVTEMVKGCDSRARKDKKVKASSSGILWTGGVLQEKAESGDLVAGRLKSVAKKAPGLHRALWHECEGALGAPLDMLGPGSTGLEIPWKGYFCQVKIT